MKKLSTLALALVSLFWLTGATWFPLFVKTVVTYQGPGDVVSGAVTFYSCARVLNASLASTSTNLCDLVSSSAPTVVLCTLRAAATGFADLSAYCPGALTPAATCAAATGGTCNISKAYNQVAPGTNDVVTAQADIQRIERPAGDYEHQRCSDDAADDRNGYASSAVHT